MIESKIHISNRITSHRVIQDFSHTGIINMLAIDARGIIVYVNEAELSLSGYTASEYLGQHFGTFYKDESVVAAILDSIRQPEGIYNLEARLHCKNGVIKDILISTRNLQDENELLYTYLFIRDITLSRKNENLLAYLNTAAEVLAGARDTKDALNKIADLIVPRFANWFTIDLLKNGELELIKIAHQNPELLKISLDYRRRYPTNLSGDAGTALVVKTGRPNFLPVVSPEMIDMHITDPVQRKIIHSLGLHSVITVAMFNKEAITGVITFVSSTPGKYDESDLRFAQNFANHIGLAIENTRLNEEALAEIDRRSKIEDELRRTQLQLKSALSSGLIGTWIRDLENNILYADESLSNLFDIEYKPEGVAPDVFISRIHPEDLVDSQLKRQEAVECGGDYEAEYRIVTKDGKVKWVFARGKTECNAEGKAVRFAGVVGDITERKKAENALKESEERFRLMAEAMPQKIFVSDVNAGLIYLNPQWEEFTGCSREEITELSLAHFIHPDDLEENLKRWSEAVQSGSEFQYEHRFRAKDGKYFWHLTRALSLHDTGGNKIWIGSITDIDEQKKKEQKKDEFISIASHELKTPITSLKGYLQILSRMVEKENNSSICDLVLKTHRQAHKLASLIIDLLDVSKMQAGKMNYNFVTFNFEEVIDDAITDAQNTYPSHRITVKGNPAVNAFGDKHRLEQVLSNLLSNAAKYSPEENEIILAISTSDDLLTVSIQDFGIGIPEEKTRFIFNRFFRAEDTSYKFTGLGIGLYISQEIIQRHKGKITFSSVVGKGSTFTVKIPLRES